jgi:LysM repeat protein
LGSHRKQSRIRRKYLLPTAAVPALAGMAATAWLAPQALADPAPAQAPAQSATVADARSYASLAPDQLIAAVKPTTGHTPGSAQAVSYTVRSGDSLSSIAGRFYHKQNAWPALYWANRSKVRWANVLGIGQVLKIPAEPAKIPGAPAQLGPVAAAPVAASGFGSGQAYAPAQAAPAAASYSGGGSFAQCVIARESGGNSQVMNSSGHYGLYQFSASTWAAYGGSAADFGHASVAEQNRVFASAVAQGGQSNWSPYDGC